MKTLAMVIASALTATLILVPAPPPAGAATSERLLSGRVVDGSGSPVEGAVVVGLVYLDGNLDLPVGAVVPQDEVARTATDPFGRFTLRVTAASDLAAIEEEAQALDGSANFEVRVASDAGLLYTLDFPREVLVDTETSASASVPRTQPAITRGPSPTPMTGVRIILSQGNPAVASLPRSRVQMVTQALALEDDKPVGCSWIKTANLDEIWGVVGQGHHWGNAIKTNFTFASGTDTVFEAGIKVPDNPWQLGGSFQTGGGAASATAAEIRYLDGADNEPAADVQARFKRIAEELRCPIPGSDALKDRRRATNWNGMDLRWGDHWYSTGDGNCDNSPYKNLFPQDQTYWMKDSAQAAWTTWGIDLGPITAGGRSGWSDHVESRFHFVTQHKLCGNNAMPVNAAIVFAGG
jgi:hypothetical protein